MPLNRKLTAESLGTFWLVFGGCGSEVLAAAFPKVGIGLLGVSFAFGLTVLTMAYSIGHISGCHLNPAVSLGLLVAKRFPAGEFIPYVIAQVLGGVAAGGVLYVIASGAPGFSLAGGMASNVVHVQPNAMFPVTLDWVVHDCTCDTCEDQLDVGAEPGNQPRDVEFVGAHPVERRQGAAEHVIAAVKSAGALQRDCCGDPVQ